MTASFVDLYKHAALVACAGRGYGHTGNPTTDCVRLQYAILLYLFGANVKALKRALHLNGRPLGSFANVQALVDAGYAYYPTGPNYAYPPGTVLYCQGWNGNRGHCFVIIWDVDGSVYILEATNSDGDTDGDGVPDRYDWFREVDWPTQASKYRDLRVAVLKDPRKL